MISYELIKRAIDVAIVLAVGPLVMPLVLLVALAVRLSSPGPVLFLSDRIGTNEVIFRMPKFRSMRVNAPQLATHLIADPAALLTPIGAYLRRSSLDELPQLWSVLKGDMSLVGPRPALFNQDDLIALRRQAGLNKLRPGVTGWAQVNGRDDLEIPQKVALDAEYLEHRCLALDIRILLLTLWKVGRREGVKH